MNHPLQPLVEKTPEQRDAGERCSVAVGSACCGNCARWQQTTRFNNPPIGKCNWRPEPRPCWFSSEGSQMLFKTDGIECQTFLPNGAAQPRPANGDKL